MAGASRAARSTDRHSHGRWLWRLVRRFLLERESDFMRQTIFLERKFAYLVKAR
jgi:hypothetical protein